VCHCCLPSPLSPVDRAQPMPDPITEKTLEATHPEPPARARVAANRFGLDYRREAAFLPKPPSPSLTCTRTSMGAAPPPFGARSPKLFGISRVFTMVRLSEAPIVREALGDMVRFIAFPDFRGEDRAKAFKDGFLADIQKFHDDFGARIVKLWNAPRLRELITGDACEGPHRVRRPLAPSGPRNWLRVWA